MTGFEEDLSRRFAVSIGFLKGGGALLGAEFEWMFADHFAASLGGGYLGVNAGLNYHFQPTTDSSYVGLFFMDQNVGQTDLEQMAAGVLVGGRLWGFLSAELGLGYVIHRGPKIVSMLGAADVPLMLVYNIGVYFTF